MSELKIQNARTDIVQLKKLEEKEAIETVNNFFKGKEKRKKEITDRLSNLYLNLNIEITQDILRVLRDATLSDAGNAERFLAVFSDKYIVINNDWYEWNGKVWEKIDESQIYHDLITVLRVSKGLWEISEADQSTENGKSVISSLTNAENESKLRAALHIAAPHLIKKSDEINQNKLLINVANCTIDLRLDNEKMYDHTRNDYMTQIARAEYDTAADMTTWENFVSEVFPDPEIRNFVQKFFGYCMTSVTYEHKFLVLVGNGSNGKSTFVNAIAYAIGSYANAIDPEVLLRSRADFDGKPTPYIASLQHKRLTVASETKRGRALNDALIKNITSDDKITARNLHRDPIEFLPSHKLILMTNYVPAFDVDDFGLKRRIIIVPCNAKFKKIDKKLSEKLKTRENMSAILNWLLDGCEKWQKEGLQVPVSIQDELSKYYEKNDELGQFINECCTVSENEAIKLTDFMQDYNTWREANGYRKEKSKIVRESLERRGFKYKFVNRKNLGRCTMRAICGLSTFSIGSEAEKEKSELTNSQILTKKCELAKQRC